MEYIYRELMTNIDRNKVETPSIDKLSKYYSVE